MSFRLSPKVKRAFEKALGSEAARSFLSLIPNLSVAADISFTVGAESTNVVLVTVQVKNENGDNLGQKTSLRFYLSSDAAGLVPAVLTSAVAAGASGAVLATATTNGAMLLTTATGLCILSLTDTGAITRYLNVVLPSGEIVTSPVITWA